LLPDHLRHELLSIAASCARCCVKQGIHDLHDVEEASWKVMGLSASRRKPKHPDAEWQRSDIY
jgi:hypothetical protein